MKIVVVGGSGLIGSKLVSVLRIRGLDVVPASPKLGVNTVTGTGLAEALMGAKVVVDVTNSPSMEDAAVMEFFRTSGGNLLEAERAAGVEHHVVLSIVGADRLPDSGYLRAKVAQERLVEAANIPYTILRATQFVEFMSRVAEYFSNGKELRVPSVGIRPIISDDVVTALANVISGSPSNSTLEIAGADALQFDDLIRRVLKKNSDDRTVISDAHARYFGAELNQDSLLPNGNHPLICAAGFEAWLVRSSAPV